MDCERCSLSSEGLSLHDYCADCYKNLCTACMEAGCCGNVPAASGMDADLVAENEAAKQEEGE